MLISVPSKPAKLPATPARPPLSLAPKPPLFDTPYILILISAFLLSLGSNTPTFYIQLFARTKGVKRSVTFNTLAIMNAGSIFGRIAPSWFADKVGAINVYIPLLAGVGESFNSFYKRYHYTDITTQVLFSSPCSGRITLSVLFYFRFCESSEFYIPLHWTEGCLSSYGFMFGSVIALYLPMIADISLRGTDMGKRMGIALAPIGVASLIGPPIAGAILGPDYTWWRPIVFSAVSTIRTSI